MKKLLVVIITILIALISYKNSDRIIRFVVLCSTTLFKTVTVKEMTVERVNEGISSLKDENGDVFDIIDSRFNMGEELEVGIDNNGTTDITDDVIVWTIKK